MAENYSIKTITGIPGWVDVLQASGKVSKEADAYSMVPLIYRAINIRCNALVAVPFHLYQGKTEKPWETVFSSPLKNLLWRTEASLLMTGASYWLAIDNGIKRLGAQWLNPFTMTVSTTQEMNPDMTYSLQMKFRQSINGLDPKDFSREQITYFREFNPKDDVLPGISATQVALNDARLLRYMVAFASAFFEGGAMPVTLLGVDGSAQDPEVEKLKSYFKRLAQGIKNAFNVIPVRGNVQVTKLTPDMNRMAFPENRSQSLQNIAWAFGIPETMLTDAANYATATAQHRSFYEETVNPRADMIAETITREFLPKGYSMTADPEEMSIFQEDEASRATSLLQLTQSGIPLQLAMEILGYELDEKQIALLNSFPDKNPDNNDDNNSNNNADLIKFHRKAIKQFEKSGSAVVDFVSESISQAVISGYKKALGDCKSREDIDAVFAGKTETDRQDAQVDQIIKMLEMNLKTMENK